LLWKVGSNFCNGVVFYALTRCFRVSIFSRYHQ
jgi:hypothetical protein